MDASTMRQIELDDALRYAKRREAEDRALGLIPDASPSTHTHAPKRGVKRSGHLGSFARRERTATVGVAAFSDDPAHIARLAARDVTPSVLVMRKGWAPEVREISRKRVERGRRVTTLAPATLPETARFATGHDFTS